MTRTTTSFWTHYRLEAIRHSLNCFSRLKYWDSTWSRFLQSQTLHTLWISLCTCRVTAGRTRHTKWILWRANFWLQLNEQLKLQKWSANFRLLSWMVLVRSTKNLWNVRYMSCWLRIQFRALSKSMTSCTAFSGCSHFYRPTFPKT